MEELLAWENHKWRKVVRGLSASEFRVLDFLCDQAGVDGYVDRLFVRTMLQNCEMGRTAIFSHLRTLQNKGFLKERIARKGAANQRVSSSYRLNVTRLFPPGNNPGTRLWIEAYSELGQQAESMAESSYAWYNSQNKVLSVWLDSGKAMRFFSERRVEWKTWGRLSDPKVRFIDFLQIPAIAKYE